MITYLSAHLAAARLPVAQMPVCASSSRPPARLTAKYYGITNSLSYSITRGSFSSVVPLEYRVATRNVY